MTTALAIPSSTAVECSPLSRMSDEWRLVGIEREKLFMRFELEPNRSAVENDYAAELGKSVKTLYRLFYAWQHKGIEGTVPKRAIRRRMADDGLKAEFVEYFRGTCESVSTPSVPAVRRLMMREFASGRRIPGLGTWQERWVTVFPGVKPPSNGADASYPRDNIEDLMPGGFSERNLSRFKSELVHGLAARQGTFAASRLGPFVYTTRAGVEVGQILMFDDVWHNQNVNYMDAMKASRPLELCCYDVRSAHKTAWGARPRLWNPETQKHEGIKAHEFRFFLAWCLCEEVGYRPDGTILWVELGTAAIDEDMEQILKAASNGAITVKRAALKDGRQACSIFRSVGSGNPRHKARLEAHHSIAHTELAHIEGQVGRNADLCPEEVYGRDKANKYLLKLAAVLPPEMASRLELPYMHWADYMELVVRAYDELSWRTWHKLEGWEACRHYTTKFRIPPFTDWVPLDAIMDGHPAQAEAIKAILEAHPEYCRIVPLSPIEVWTQHKSEMVKLPKSAMPLILGPDNGIIRKCPDTADIKFGSRDLGPEPHIYSREYVDEDGIARRLHSGCEYLFHVNPFSRARELMISDKDGRYLGTSARIAVPCQADADAVQARIVQKRAEWNRIIKTVTSRHLGKLAKQADAMGRNAAIVGVAAAAGLLGEGQKPAPSGHGSDDSDAAILELYGE